MSPKGSQKRYRAHGLIPVWRGVYIRYFKINPPIFCCPLFSENYLNPQVKISKMVNKHTVNYHPSPSQLISRIYPLVFLWTPKGFMSPELFLNFFLNLYSPPWLQKSFKFIVPRLLQIHLWVNMPPKKKSLPGFYYYPPGRQELSIPPKKRFLKIFFPEQERGERIMELKKLIKLTRVLVTSFDKFHHLCNFYIFSLCFAVQ